MEALRQTDVMFVGAEQSCRVLGGSQSGLGPDSAEELMDDQVRCDQIGQAVQPPYGLSDPLPRSLELPVQTVQPAVYARDHTARERLIGESGLCLQHAQLRARPIRSSSASIAPDEQQPDRTGGRSRRLRRLLGGRVPGRLKAYGRQPGLEQGHLAVRADRRTALHGSFEVGGGLLVPALVLVQLASYPEGLGDRVEISRTLESRERLVRVACGPRRPVGTAAHQLCPKHQRQAEIPAARLLPARSHVRPP